MGGGAPRAASVLIDEVAHGAQVSGVFGKGGIDGLGQRVGTMGVEDLQEPTGEDPQVHTVLGG